MQLIGIDKPAQLLKINDTLSLDTRKKNPIKNEIIRSLPDEEMAGHRLQIKDLRKKYPKLIHRPTNPSKQYNCHGLTFAARRVRIWDPAEVEKILADDGYRQIPMLNVLAGDVVIYEDPQSNSKDHSGIVVQADKDKDGIPFPLILSKWGELHEVIHPAHISPYQGWRIIYFRLEE